MPRPRRCTSVSECRIYDLMTVAARASDYYSRYNTLQRACETVYALVSKVDRMSARGYDTFMSEGHIAWCASDSVFGADFGARCLRHYSGSEPSEDGRTKFVRFLMPHLQANSSSKFGPYCDESPNRCAPRPRPTTLGGEPAYVPLRHATAPQG